MVEITPGSTTDAAFRELLAERVREIGDSLPPTIAGDPEGLHRLRIALRGARATLQLFAPILAGAGLRSLDRDLRRVCRVCGVCRDWDVFRLETLPAARRALPFSDMGPIAEAAQAYRTAAHAAVVEAVGGARFASLVDRLETLGRGAGLGTRPIVSSAPMLLDRVARRAARRGRHVGRLSAIRRHAYRKALDRLFDDTGGFVAVFAGAQVEHYRARCMALQAILGTANDAAVAGRLIAALMAEGHAACARPGRALMLWNTQRHRLALKGLKRAHRQFRHARRFWHAR